MESALLLNITICFAITLISFTFAWVLIKTKDEREENNKPSFWNFVALWALVGSIYLPTTIRMIAAYTGNTGIDTLMYNISAVPFAFLTVPMVYFILYAITGDKRIGGYFSLLFATFGVTYLMFLFKNGVIGPTVSEWSSLFAINSSIAIHIYLIALFIIPTGMILGLLLLILLQRFSKKIQYRTTLPLVAISFVIDFILVDMTTTLDVLQLVSRIFVLIGAILAYLALYPPQPLQEKLGFEEPEIYEEYLEDIELKEDMKDTEFKEDMKDIELKEDPDV